MLTIEQPLSISSIEDYLDDLWAGGDIPLSFPLKLEQNYFGTKAAFCQFILTWVHAASDRSDIFTQGQKTWFANRTTGYLKDEVASLLAVLMTYKYGRKIRDKEHEDITSDVVKDAILSLRAGLPVITADGRKIFSAELQQVYSFCFDHARDKDYIFNPWFYLQPDALADETAFIRFYKAGIEKLFAKKSSRLLNAALEPKYAGEIGGILKELFENTHKHARKEFGDRSNVPIMPNARGILVDAHTGNRKFFRDRTAEGDPFYVYFSNHELFGDDRHIRTFIEISVIDAGPGFAPRRSGKPLSELLPEEEKKYVLQCFLSLDKTPFKRGLKRISEIASLKKGFMRLRTGRLSLYRNFLLTKYHPEDHNPQYEIEAMGYKFFDWYDDDRNTSLQSPVCGSLITLLLPID